MQVLQHKHLIFRIETATPPTNKVVVGEWMKNLINKLGMKLYAGPIVRYLDEPGNRGITAVCIIKTSHLSMHVWDEPNPGIIQFDVYTCGSMKVEDVIAELQVFNPSKIEYKFLDRENNLTLVEEGIL